MSRRSRFVLVGALALLLRVVPAWFLGTEENYLEMATVVLRGDDVYAVHSFFPYMPYSLGVPAAALLLARTLAIPFPFALKLPGLVADAAFAMALLAVLERRAGSRDALLFTLAFVLNPVSLLVSAFHGNLMELVAVCVAFAVVAGERAREEEGTREPYVAIAALLLGIALALRSFPVLLVPAFAFWLSRSPRELVRFGALAAAPALVSAIPYLVWDRADFLREVLSYSGSPDIGWLAALRAVPLAFSGVKLFAFAPGVLAASKLLFLLAWAVSLLPLPWASEADRRRAILVPALLFFGLYGGVSTQYLAWIVPTAALLRERWLAGFTALATVAMLALYLVYHSEVLAGRPGTLEGPAAHLALLAGNAALAALSCAWAVRIVWRGAQTAPRAVRRALAAGGLATALLAGVLLVRGALEAAAAMRPPAALLAR